MTKTGIAVTGAILLLAACREAGEPAEPVENQAASAAENEVAAPPLAPPPTREAALKLMHDRHENMEDIGKATKAAGRTLKSNSPDLAVIRASAATYSELAPHVPSWFPPGTGPDVGKTYAKPAVWEKPEDFAQKTRDFQAAVRKFDSAAKGGDVAAVKAAFGDLGKTCKSCHDSYRTEHKH